MNVEELLRSCDGKVYVGATRIPFGPHLFSKNLCRGLPSPKPESL